MTHPLRIALLSSVIIAVYLIYLPGVGGALYYDDHANLRHLAQLGEGKSLWDFVFSGEAGPLGRPVALLSFVPHADGWPENVKSILHVNVLIHVFNMLLLFALTRLVLARFDPSDDARNFRVAISAALLWAVLPLLVSTTLIAIQRMAGLAAFFGLCGLVGFVWGYRFASRSPRAALALQLSALGVGTALAVFAKESGALIPIFALLIDFLLIRNVNYEVRYRRILRLALFVCLMVPLYYISPMRGNFFAVDDFRGFSPWQRMQSQWVTLWEYLWRAFLPGQPTAFGPFQDQYELVREGWKIGLALAAWCCALAVTYFVRRICVLPLFALLWFFAGHLLESTSILLELVFEHRNYLAIYGFCVLLAWLAWNAKGRLARVAPILYFAYIGLLASITLSMTALWGQPADAAHVWADKNPSSARAALHVAFIEIGSREEEFAKRDVALSYAAMERALIVLDRTSRVCPGCIDVQMQALAYSCRVTSIEDTASRTERLQSLVATGEVNIAVIDAFFPLHQLIGIEACPPLTFIDLLRIAETLIENERSQPRIYRSRLHFVAAMYAQSLGELDKMRSHLELAEGVDPSAMPILQFQVYSALDAGRFDDALSAVERRRRLAGVVGNRITHDVLDELINDIEEARRGAS